MLRDFHAAPRRHLVVAAILLATSLLAGCGIKGALTLPPPAPTPTTSSTPAPAGVPAEAEPAAAPATRTNP